MFKEPIQKPNTSLTVNNTTFDVCNRCMKSEGNLTCGSSKCCVGLDYSRKSYLTHNVTKFSRCRFTRRVRHAAKPQSRTAASPCRDFGVAGCGISSSAPIGCDRRRSRGHGSLCPSIAEF